MGGSRRTLQIAENNDAANNKRMIRCLILGQRRKRWPRITSTSSQRVFCGCPAAISHSVADRKSPSCPDWVRSPQSGHDWDFWRVFSAGGAREIMAIWLSVGIAVDEIIDFLVVYGWDRWGCGWAVNVVRLHVRPRCGRCGYGDKTAYSTHWYH